MAVEPGDIKGAVRGDAPRSVRPMLAVNASLPRDPEPYGFEYKWDGIRLIFHSGEQGHRLQTRNQVDVTHSYPELKALADGLKGTKTVLDGEVVALNEEQKPDFGLLQHRTGLTNPGAVAGAAARIPVTYMVFDVLFLDGYLLEGLAYRDRRKVLEGMELEGPYWYTPPSVEARGEEMLQAARSQKLEGVIAKRLDSAYQQGKRSRDWLKVKLVRRQEFVVGGWTPSSASRRSIGSLLLGYYARERGNGELEEIGTPYPLLYAGKVGTGFSGDERAGLADLLEPRRTDESPFSQPTGEKDAAYCRPELVAEVEFGGWTDAGKLRQASFKGLRDDKDPRTVVREDAG